MSATLSLGAQRILELRATLLDAIRPLGYRLYIEECDLDPATPESARSGIIAITHPTRDLTELARILASHQVTVSLRQNRHGQAFVRFSPHFYNTPEELAQVVALME